MKAKLIFLFLAAAMLNGCAHRGGESDQASASNSTSGSRTVVMSNGEEGEIIGTPAPGSKFSKIQLNMSRRQVESLIGPPDDETGHLTGKAFIPFFFGGDSYRTEAFYKGEGQLTYSPRSIGAEPNQLIKMEVNPAATGFSE
ncbi:hypothetical protein SAMN07250955_11659 [Arboricoccus pini]|uniref:Beta-barrel assembly machine subunit BamE n=1 Tax=Arboricoccus pini TaxID=1963835 RepID=A0A212RXF9_9PROT|nr:hypothetical protein [Arboricoccus pini]SNB77313.1 hypothetical protein SAMN07250955_11659 [Arboricoccus pini]